MRWPSATPAGMRTLTSRARRSTPVPAAVRARVVDDDALTVAGGARRGEREEALVVVDDAPALARGAHVRRRAGLGTGAVAHRARRLGRELERGGDAVDGVGERQRAAWRRGPRPAGARRRARRAGAAASPAAEQVAQDVAQPVAGT